MSTPIISRELRQMVASIRRDKVTGYVSLEHTERGRQTQGIMQFVEGKLAYVSYGEARNKDALERIKELTSPELSFGEGLSEIYLHNLDARTQLNPETRNAPTTAPPKASNAMHASGNQAMGLESEPNPLGRSTRTPTDAFEASVSNTMPNEAIPTANDDSDTFTFEDHTGQPRVQPPIRTPQPSAPATPSAVEPRSNAVTGQPAPDTPAASRPPAGTTIAASSASRLADQQELPWHQRIQTKATAILALTTLLTLLGFGIYDFLNARNNLNRVLESYADDVTNQLASHAALPLWDYDQDVLNASIKAEMRDPRLHAVQVTDPANNERFAGQQRSADGSLRALSTPPTGNLDYIQRQASIRNPFDGSSEIGSLELWISRESVAIESRRLLRERLLRYALLGTLLTLVTFFLLRNILIQPILRLTQAANAISTGQADDDQLIDINSNDEIGLLANAIRRMQASLQFAMRRLRR